MNKIEKKLFIKEAVKILKGNISQILTVKDWAKMMHFSRSSFYSKFDKCKYSPKHVLKIIRYGHIINHLKKSPLASSYEIAVKVGLHNSKAMYKFLHIHFDTTFSELKNEGIIMIRK